LLGWIIVMLILVWTPGKALPKPDFLDITLIEFTAHFGMFLVFSFLLTGSINLNSTFNLSAGKTCLLVVLISLLFSVFTESGQFLVPGRYFHMTDMGMNFLGSLGGIGLFFLKIKYFSN